MRGRRYAFGSPRRGRGGRARGRSRCHGHGDRVGEGKATEGVANRDCRERRGHEVVHREELFGVHGGARRPSRRFSNDRPDLRYGGGGLLFTMFRGRLSEWMEERAQMATGK